MHDPAGGDGPFPFTASDLAPRRLSTGVSHTLADFRRWRDAHPGRVAAHVDHYRAHVAALAAAHRLPAVAGRRLSPRRRRREDHAHAVREVVHFGAYDMAEVFSPAAAAALAADARAGEAVTAHPRAEIDPRGGVDGMIAALTHRVPVLHDRPETRWLAGRLTRLHRALPESVVRSGSMGKVVRTVVGVLTIGAYAVRTADRDAVGRHLADILPAAYAYGAAYAIVDDTLHDLRSATLPDDERQHYHDLVTHGLATGDLVDASQLPDHPLAEELHDLHVQLLARYPFAEYRHLYHATEAMYHAQHRDAARSDAARSDAARSLDPTGAAGPDDLYPELFVKAGMSRVIANILAGRKLGDDFYARCVNTTFMSQLRDDLVDRHEDRAQGRLTPFTAPRHSDGTDPLYDLFAYSAYVCDQVYGGDPTVTDALTYRGARRLAAHLTGGPGRADELLRTYDASDEIARFLRCAAGLPARASRRLDDTDQRIKHQIGDLLRNREPTAADCRTYVADRLPYIDEVLQRYRSWYLAGELGEVVAYAMAGTAKRLRPALTLMLADTLGVEAAAVEPMLVAGELFHTASLIVDDLPAQDDATVRRGRPAVHLAFDEAAAQLAAVSMISSGFGLVAQLDRRFSPARVNEVVSYVGAVFGPARLCRGQYLDLRMSSGEAVADPAAIQEVYRLKTSTAIEASLVPLAMVLERPSAETAALSRYAHHAGVVFQLRDDILDATAGPEELGKDADHDTGKVNVVRSAGLAEAQRLTEDHVAAACDALADLPHDTRLLECTVRHFATRRR